MIFFFLRGESSWIPGSGGTDPGYAGLLPAKPHGDLRCGCWEGTGNSFEHFRCLPPRRRCSASFLGGRFRLPPPLFLSSLTGAERGSTTPSAPLRLARLAEERGALTPVLLAGPTDQGAGALGARKLRARMMSRPAPHPHLLSNEATSCSMERGGLL